MNRIRECKRTKEDFDVLRTRMISKNEQSLKNPLLQPHIFLQIKMFKVSIYRFVNCQKEENCTNEAQDNIIGDVDEEIQLKVRKTFQLIPTKLSKKS